MPRQTYTAAEAARRLGISIDTLRRWDRDGLIRTERDSGNRRLVPATEVERLRAEDSARGISARNRFVGTVTEVKTDGLMAQVELVVTEPARVVALVTRDAVDDLGLKPGMSVTAIVKSTSVMVEH
ncbi:MAG TPA: helix-turn-helix transcriptional regulator [Gaiellaceae bacterium]|jgi:molybdopterin-binding protein|nr:helix-turn-helix transcriptional regulator [Gaiellaceae bacterium]